MLHADWSTPAFDLEPAATRTGPFPRRPFLETWWDWRSGPGDRLAIADTGDGLAPLVVREGVLEFAGEADLTDYHTPLGPGSAAAVVEALTSSGATGYRLDSLPDEAAAVVAKALADIGADSQPRRHDVAAVLALPPTFERWLEDLPKKERHEVRRKRRRYAAELGVPELVRDTSADSLAEFVAMHRAAEGEKGEFFDGPMAEFFSALVARAGFAVDFLIAKGTPVAAAFGHEDGDGYYLYNSAYDPKASSASPGMVLLTELIAAQIARGAVLLDFMKGDEGYKFRLGAEPRHLVAFAGDLP